MFLYICLSTKPNIIIRESFYDRFILIMQNNLHISKKSSTFARILRAKGFIDR